MPLHEHGILRLAPPPFNRTTVAWREKPGSRHCSAPASSRKPGAWADLPKAMADWDAPATNRAIANALTGAKLP